MPIPDFQTIMLPLLEYLKDGKEHTVREAIDSLAARFILTDAERRELLPSGRQSTFDNRVGWSRTYMKKAGLIESKTRGHVQITERGMEALKGNPSRIDIRFLEQYEGRGADAIELSRDGGAIDAITAATISSRAVTNAVRDTLNVLRKSTDAVSMASPATGSMNSADKGVRQ